MEPTGAGAYPPAFAALYEELKGDLFVARGDIEQARMAYDRAIQQAGAESRLLQIKRRELGDNGIKPGETEPSA